MERRPIRSRGILDKIVAEEAADWHFNPMLKSDDYWKIGNIRQGLGAHWDRLVDFAFDLDQRVDRTSAFDYPLTNDDTLARLAAMGYDENGTALFRTFSDVFPDVFDPVLAACDLIDPVGCIIHQRPGWTNPWHYDLFEFYTKKFKVKDPKSIGRYVVFLEDWVWGHYMLVGNSVVHQWRAGDVISWPFKMRHLSANAGLTPKLTLQVTGKRPSRE
jgi:hypothetical protein